MPATKDTPFHKAIAEIQARSREYYPGADYFNEGRIQGDETHSIWYGQAGNPNGIPVLCIHGGPGGSCSSTDDPKRSPFTKYFDTTKYCVTVFDQRGCGNSTPHACVKNNTQWETAKDIIKILDVLKIEKTIVFGGSWGSTMSLVFAELHPERCLSLVLRGIFNVAAKELAFLYEEGGAGLIFPEFWENYIAPIPKEERGALMKAYNKRLFNDDDKEEQLRCARAWSVWEGATCLAIPELSGKYSEAHFALAFARVENSYFCNGGWWPAESGENWIYDNAHKLKDLDVFVVHGRYDMVCVIDSMYRLKKALPHAEYVVAPLSGHSSSCPDIASILLNATDKYAEKFKHLIK